MDAQLDCYDDQPKRTGTLDAAYRIESKTRQFPFVVASDIDNKIRANGNNEAGETVIIKNLSYQDLLMGTFDDSSKNNSSKQSSVESQSKIKKVSYEDLLLGNVPTIDPSQLADSDSDEDSKGKEEADAPAKEEATREFYVFHDIEHFLKQKEYYPHTHEIIRCPGKKEMLEKVFQKTYNDEVSRGRLIFDFDLEHPLEVPTVNHDFEKPLISPNMQLCGQRFVPSNFKVLIEFLVMKTFSKYYLNIDASKLIFVWQITRHPNKFSMHLIVKNAYFSEYWVKQMRVFYYLMSHVAYKNDMGYLMKTVDFQIPRRNATFRMIGSSKINGLPLELDSCHCNGTDMLTVPGFQLTIYDCLAGIYHSEHLKSEQYITMDNVNYTKIENELIKVETVIGSNNKTNANNRQLNKSRIGLANSSNGLNTSGGGLNNSQLNIEADMETIRRFRKFKEVIDKNLGLVDDTKSKINIDNTEVEKAVKIFTSREDICTSFSVRDQVGDIINLNRTRRGICPVSGQMHDRENAYLKLRIDGHLIFNCRRGCKHRSETGYETYGIDLGIYRTRRREAGIIPINPAKLIMSPNTVVEFNETKFVPAKTPEPQEFRPGKMKTSAKLAPIGCNTVQIPSWLLSNRKEKVLLVCNYDN